MHMVNLMNTLIHVLPWYQNQDHVAKKKGNEVGSDFFIWLSLVHTMTCILKFFIYLSKIYYITPNLLIEKKKGSE